MTVELFTEKKATESAADQSITTEVLGRGRIYFPYSHILPQAPTDAPEERHSVQ